MPRQSLFTIAPDAPFLPTLVARVLDGTLLAGWPQQGPFWLSDVTIILPTRRARLKLAELFTTQLGGAALLPDIRTFGGEVEDEEPFLPPFDTPPPLPPVGGVQRTLTLARLVDAWARTPRGRQVLATPPYAAEILGLGASLGTLIDDLIIENVPATKLGELPPEDLAANWQQTLEILNIALEAWPQHVAALGKAEPAALRNERLLRQAQTATTIYGDRPVIAAGSTGSIPATGELLTAIARLPRGSVVLPGLDTMLTPEQHEMLLDHDRIGHGHPQYGLARLLRRLGTTHQAVDELSDGPGPRVRVVRRALDMVDGTADWATARAALSGDLASAVDGLTIVAARTEEQEARAIAIAARQVLARKQTVGILSPDQTLSRRIAAELMRFEIAVDDAAGVPLYQSAAGRFARALLALAVGNVAPVDLMAVLQNRAASFGLPRSQVSRAARLIDLGLLRGQYLRPGFAGLRRALAENVDRTTKYPARRLFADDAELIGPVLNGLETAVAPLVSAVGSAQIAAPQLVRAVAAVVDAATKPGTGDNPPPMPGRAELIDWAAAFAEAEEAGPPFRPVALDAVLATLMAGHKVTTPQTARDDIAIWGLLEARLQSADLTILAGLNEDVWPAAADPGPWLSRGMRIKAGLEPPERQQGQAAHDFEMALGGRQVLLCFAERRGTSPALPSRLVQRLEAFLGDDVSKELRARARPLLAAAQAVDFAGMPAPARRPFPRPPVAVRPKALSVTEIERLYRSPYDLYARHVLRLGPLAPLGQEPGGRERGSLIHDVFARFVMEDRPLDGVAQAVLEQMAAEAFGGLDAIGERRDIWLKRFSVAAALFLDFERARDAGVLKRNAEVEGRQVYPSGFTLTGRADRIDQLTDGTLEILDFKTGTVPAPKEMRAFEAPQLLLEAVMAAVGAFMDLPPAQASALTYIKIGSGAKAYRPQAFTPPGDDLVAAILEANARLQRHVDALLLNDKLPMGARIVPDAKQRFRGDYDHLARTEEWLVQEDPDF